jgi:hypothetical protein
MGQHAPGAAAAQQIEDPIQDPALRVGLGPSSRFRVGYQMLDQRPFSITEVGRVSLSRVHAPDDTRS